MPCCKMPAHTKEQVFAGLKFQAEGTDGITGMLTFTLHKRATVHRPAVGLRKNALKDRAAVSHTMLTATERDSFHI